MGTLELTWLRWVAVLGTGLTVASSSTVAAQSSAKGEPGLILTCNVADGQAPREDWLVAPEVSLYVPAGQSVTPFLPAGRFTAVWSGFIAVDLRSDYLFQAELNGEFKLEINGATVLEASGAATAPSKPVRLNKGTNLLTATFRSPAQGDAFLRLNWFNKETVRGPIPLNDFSHPMGNANLQRTEQLRFGRELFIEHRCAKCHALAQPGHAIPELGMDAPAFEGIGSRRNQAWLARWILDPQAQRATAHMPTIFHDAKAKDNAAAVAAFLATLKTSSASPEFKPPTGEQVEMGKRLFASLHCTACHNAPDMAESDVHKLSLKQVRAKFASGNLTDFLLKPEAHYAWTRMPNSKLTIEEAAALAAFLDSAADQTAETATAVDGLIIERGKRLVQTSGCLNCHALKLENQFKTKSLSELPVARWNSGCLADPPADDSKSPRFRFSVAEREALRAFAATDRASLSRHVAAEFAERQSRLLNCRECHGKAEGVPPFESLGEKLKPEWAARFIGGEVSDKPRPWLDARMPAFAQRAGRLAQGMAMLHGYSPHTPAEPPIDSEAARQGQKLVSAVGGFSCVTCHAVGKNGANQIFESPGVNLTFSGERLRRSYFQRWVRNPIQVDPATKMPVYFDENGRSPLPDFYAGDGEKTINAIWQYLRLGENLPPPPSP